MKILLLLVAGYYGYFYVYPYFLVTPLPQIQYEIKGDFNEIKEVVTEFWNNLSRKVDYCANIKGKYRLNFQSNLSFFMGRRLVAQGCSPMNQEYGCFFMLEVNERQQTLHYTGQMCKLEGFYVRD